MSVAQWGRQGHEGGREGKGLPLRGKGLVAGQRCSPLWQTFQSRSAACPPIRWPAAIRAATPWHANAREMGLGTGWRWGARGCTALPLLPPCACHSIRQQVPSPIPITAPLRLPILIHIPSPIWCVPLVPPCRPSPSFASFEDPHACMLAPPSPHPPGGGGLAFWSWLWWGHLWAHGGPRLPSEAPPGLVVAVLGPMGQAEAELGCFGGSPAGHALLSHLLSELFICSQRGGGGHHHWRCITCG